MPRPLRFALLLALWSAALSAREELDCARLSRSARPEPPGYAEACAPERFWTFALEISPRQSESPGHDARAHDVRVGQAGNFVRHRLNDFPAQEVLGLQTDFIAGYDFSPDGSTLYALNGDTNELGTVDPDSGAFTPRGRSTPAAGEEWTGLAVDPMTGTLYATTQPADPDRASALYLLNALTGAATLVGSTSPAKEIIAIAMNCDGELYGHSKLDDAIYRLDPATGAATLVGPTGLDSQFAQGMDFDSDTGTLYAWTHQGAGDNQYGTIDLSTGLLTPLAVNNPFGEFEGATLTYCAPFALLFTDGFESGDTSAWDATTD